MPGCVKRGVRAWGVVLAVRHEARRTDGEVCGAARGALRWCAPLPHVADRERVRPERSGMGRCGGAWVCETWCSGLGCGFIGRKFKYFSSLMTNLALVLKYATFEPSYTKIRGAVQKIFEFQIFHSAEIGTCL